MHRAWATPALRVCLGRGEGDGAVGPPPRLSSTQGRMPCHSRHAGVSRGWSGTRPGEPLCPRSPPCCSRSRSHRRGAHSSRCAWPGQGCGTDSGLSQAACQALAPGQAVPGVASALSSRGSRGHVPRMATRVAPHFPILRVSPHLHTVGGLLTRGCPGEERPVGEDPG